MKTTLKKLTTLAVSAALTLGSILPVSAAVVNYGEELENAPDKNNYTQAFSDVPRSYWAFGYIGEMVDRDVLSGYPDGKFYPDKNVTRGEFAKIMSTAAGFSVNEYDLVSTYVDVINHWSAPYVNASAYYLGGYTMNGEKYYKPDSPALREDIAVALVRLKGYSTSGYDLSIIQTMFSDWQSISSSAQPYVATAVEKGLISGYENGTFKGQQGITRAEAATLLWRAYQYGNDNKVFEPEILPEIITTPEPTVAPTSTPKPAKTPKPTVEPDEDYDDEDEDNYDDDDGYGWVVNTIKHSVDNMYEMQIVPDGLSYMMSSNDNQIYCMDSDGETNVIFDADDLDYLGDVELTRKDTFTTTLHCYGYNYYDDCFYAVVSQTNTGTFLYNISNDEVVVIFDGIGYTDSWREEITEVPIKFYKNGDISLKLQTIGTESDSAYGELIVTTDNVVVSDIPIKSRSFICGSNDGIILGNKHYRYIDYFLDESFVEHKLSKPIICGKNKLYGWDYDDIWNVYSKRIQLMSIDFESGDADVLLFIDDIENPEGRKFDIKQILKYGAIDDEDEGNEVIYFYDADYKTIRKIERND